MKLQQQVCTLELAKRLKEYGVKQESYFIWQVWGDNIELSDRRAPTILADDCDDCAAFTVAELGEMLPQGYWDEESVYGGFEVGYSQGGKEFGPDNVQRYFTLEQNEANARAKMLVYLLENKLLTI